MTDIRVTRKGLEVATDLTTDPEVRMTRLSLEVLTSLALAQADATARRTINVTYT